MLLLILTVCSLSAPDRCNETRVQFSSDELLRQCMMAAPPYIAQWAGEHPDALVTRWRCAYPDSEGDRI